LSRRAHRSLSGGRGREEAVVADPCPFGIPAAEGAGLAAWKTRPSRDRPGTLPPARAHGDNRRGGDPAAARRELLPAPFRLLRDGGRVWIRARRALRRIAAVRRARPPSGDPPRLVRHVDHRGRLLVPRADPPVHRPRGAPPRGGPPDGFRGGRSFVAALLR